jgi:hypothetical protein
VFPHYHHYCSIPNRVRYCRPHQSLAVLMPAGPTTFLRYSHCYLPPSPLPLTVGHAITPHPCLHSSFSLELLFFVVNCRHLRPHCNHVLTGIRVPIVTRRALAVAACVFVGVRGFVAAQVLASMPVLVSVCALRPCRHSTGVHLMKISVLEKSIGGGGV